MARRVALVLAAASAVACVLMIVGAGHTEWGAALHAAWGCYLALIATIAAGWIARGAL